MSFLRLLRTTRHLRPVQVYGRLWFKFFRPAPDMSPAPLRRALSGSWMSPAERKPSMSGPDEFCFLNDARRLASKADWDRDEVPLLWRYNLHYFDDLNAEGAAGRVQWHSDLISRWIGENPPARGNGWEPYPSSLRIVNWIKWALNGNSLSTDAQASLAVQTRWLRRHLEIHLLGNHLFTNAKALVFAGLFFDGAEASGWLKKGCSLLERELAEQMLPDGGHFERSPMYHAIMLEDMLDLVNLHRTFGMEVPPGWHVVIEKMRAWLSVMSHPDGEIAFFNDAAIGVAIAPARLEEYAQRLGYPRLEPLPMPVTSLPESGYVRVCAGAVSAYLDLAPIGPDYLPGHAHADTLSFELSVGRQRVLVNSGTSEYGSGPERLRQRGTAAHNALTIDAQDSSEVWAGFRVGRRAHVTSSAVRMHDRDGVTVSGMHDGYRYLPGSPMHSREWDFKRDGLSVIDRLTGEGEHCVEILFHLHPDCRAFSNDAGGVSVMDAQGNLLCVIAMTGGARLEVRPSTYHPEFGLVVENQLISHRWTGSLPVSFETHIGWK